MVANMLVVYGIIFGSLTMEREVMWVSVDEKIFEHLRLSISPEIGIKADGWIVHLNEKSYRIQYKLECDSAWIVRRMEFTRWDKNMQKVVFHSDGLGRWTNHEGKNLPELDGCIDVDIYASPFTNTLAIRRLALQEGDAKTIQVAFVNLPELKITPVKQRYTLLKTNPDGSVYRYEGLDSGYTVELPVDTDGLVIDYPEFFKRVWSSR